MYVYLYTVDVSYNAHVCFTRFTLKTNTWNTRLSAETNKPVYTQSYTHLSPGLNAFIWGVQTWYMYMYIKVGRFDSLLKCSSHTTKYSQRLFRVNASPSAILEDQCHCDIATQTSLYIWMYIILHVCILYYIYMCTTDELIWYYKLVNPVMPTNQGIWATGVGKSAWN